MTSLPPPTVTPPDADGDAEREALLCPVCRLTVVEQHGQVCSSCSAARHSCALATVVVPPAEAEGVPGSTALPATAKSSPGERLFDLLKVSDPDAEIDDYYSQDGGWDIEGMRADLKLATTSAASKEEHPNDIAHPDVVARLASASREAASTPGPLTPTPVPPAPMKTPTPAPALTQGQYGLHA